MGYFFIQDQCSLSYSWFSNPTASTTRQSRLSALISLGMLPQNFFATSRSLTNTQPSVAEVGIGVICACLPAFNIFFRKKRLDRSKAASDRANRSQYITHTKMSRIKSWRDTESAGTETRSWVKIPIARTYVEGGTVRRTTTIRTHVEKGGQSRTPTARTHLQGGSQLRSLTGSPYVEGKNISRGSTARTYVEEGGIWAGTPTVRTHIEGGVISRTPTISTYSEGGSRSGTPIMRTYVEGGSLRRVPSTTTYVEDGNLITIPTVTYIERPALTRMPTTTYIEVRSMGTTDPMDDLVLQLERVGTPRR